MCTLFLIGAQSQAGMALCKTVRVGAYVAYETTGKISVFPWTGWQWKYGRTVKGIGGFHWLGVNLRLVSDVRVRPVRLYGPWTLDRQA